MTLRIIGAGLGRTGTKSLKLALEQLLGAPCYHMSEVFQHPEHIPHWHAAARGEMPDWHALFAGYGAAVDWPAGSFWPEISEAFPDALVVLTARDAQSWWESAHATIFQAMKRVDNDPWREMIDEMFRSRFTPALDDEAACVAAYERHVAHVRDNAPKARFLEWSPRDGWQPLCHALGVPVPDAPFPHANSREEFLAGHQG
ncbi:MAG TPA: sulfotransferase [Rhodanobacteraceae bacterium]|nr:sulfotransferase [Rhodanobacteraceae bacterium]